MTTSDPEVLSLLLDDLPVGVWVARAPGGEEIYANRMFAEIMGQGGRQDTAVGNYGEPYGILTRDGRPYPEERMPFVRALVERRVVVVDDLTIRRPDGTSVHVRAFARPVLSPSGEVTHVVIAFFDITKQVLAELARAESERRLQRAQRLEAVGTLAGGIAHDFNNLVFGVKLLALELAVGESDPERLAMLRTIDGITERSAALTRSLLAFARRGRHRVAPVALDRVVGAMRELLTRTMTGVAVGVELDPAGGCDVLGDESQLEQVVMNLVVNARDAASAQGGRVAVRTRREGERVILEVADDGPGVPPELRERIFEPYFTTKAQGSERGTGLGLATVFGIVESHGGSIDVLPGLDGRGTTLRVSLPAALAAAAPPAEVRAPAPRGTGTVLVVDDDEIVRAGVAAALRAGGYTTLEAASGAEALALARPEVDVVVLDLVMPGMGGAAVFEALCALRLDVRVVILSAHPVNEDVQSLLDAGCVFVAKPCAPDELLRAVATVGQDAPPRGR